MGILGNLFKTFWTIFKYPFYLILFLYLVFMILYVGNIIYFTKCKGIKKPHGVHVKLKNRNFFIRLFWDAPRRMALDYLNRNPEFFKYQGVIIFTGRQGSGKTMALIEQTMRMQREYPKCKVIGNLNYKFQDDILDDWHQLIDYKNDIQGVIVQMDEMQNWFSSNQSKEFPPEMLEVITQNRKNRRVILGTSQVFSRLSKPLREQATEERSCLTFFGCITVVIRKELFLDSEGNVEKKKNRGMYFFVHNEDLRNAYDTYHVIESLAKSGFQPRQSEHNVNNNIVISKKGVKNLK